MSIAATTERAVGRRLAVAFLNPELALEANCLDAGLAAVAFLVTALRGADFVAVLVVAVFFDFVVFLADDFLAVAFDESCAFFLTAELAFLATAFALVLGFLDLVAFAVVGFLVAFAVGFDAFALEAFLTVVLVALDFFFWTLDFFFEPPTAETSDFVSGLPDAFCDSACSAIWENESKARV